MSATAAPQVYGADEVNAVVLDVGSSTTQYGFAGLDQPNCVVSSVYGQVSGEERRIFDENILYSTQRSDMTIKPIVRNNIVQDWEAAVDQWQYLTKLLNVDPSEQPLLHTESTMNSFNNKKKAMEVAFETLGHCAYFAVKQPTCVSFAHGRPNCLVVDIGDELCTVTPVIDGFCLKNHVMGTKYAGGFLDQELLQMLQLRGFTNDVIWKQKFTKGTEWEGSEKFQGVTSEAKDCQVDQSVLDFAMKRTLREMKESVVECCLDDELNPNESDLINPSDEALDDEETRFFELPNGTGVPFTLRERQLLGNSLFHPNNTVLGLGEIIQGWEDAYTGDIRSKLVKTGDITSKEYVPLRRSKKTDDDDGSKSTEPPESSGEPLGLTDLVNSVLNRLDVDIKPQLANNIILTGSTSLIPKLSERLTQDLILLNPSMKIRVHCSGNPIERKYGSWIGGSILASLGTFHQLWVSKTEWEEVGPERLVVNRFR